MLKRAFVLLSGTVTGLVGVLSYNPPHFAGAISTPVTTPDQPVSQAVQSETNQSGNAPKPNGKKSSTSTSADTQKVSDTPQKNSTPSTTQAKPAPVGQQAGSGGTFQGNTISTKYGPVQVQITVANGQITNAEALAYPTRDRRSMQISQAVIPWLSQETLRIQSASVMAVSGATITTNAWNNSLASALQKAGK